MIGVGDALGFEESERRLQCHQELSFYDLL